MNHSRRRRFAAAVAGVVAALAVAAAPASAARDDGLPSEGPANDARALAAAVTCADLMFDPEPRSYDEYTTDAARGGNVWGQVRVDRRGTYGGFPGYTVCIHSGLDDRALDGRAAISYATYRWWGGSQWQFEPHHWLDRVDGEGAPVRYYNALFDFPTRDFYVGVCLGPIDAPRNCDSDID